MPSLTPPLIWAQRFEKVFVTFDQLNCKDVKIEFTDGLMSLEATSGEKQFKLDNMPLWAEIDVEESKWFVNDRCAAPRLRGRGPTLSSRARAGTWSSR
jgi:hypothetical protein